MLSEEDAVKQVVAAHRERYGRLDVLVNNAGVGIGAPVAEIQTKRLDMQLDVNLRSIVLFYRECVELLRAARAGARHRAGRQHLLDLRQARAGVAVGLLGHEGRRRRLDGGDEQGAGARGDQVVRALPRVRRHADDGLREGRRRRRGADDHAPRTSPSRCGCC